MSEAKDDLATDEAYITISTKGRDIVSVTGKNMHLITNSVIKKLDRAIQKKIRIARVEYSRTFRTNQTINNSGEYPTKGTNSQPQPNEKVDGQVKNVDVLARLGLKVSKSEGDE